MSPPRLRIPEEEQRYHLAMAGLCLERGLVSLSRSHQIAAEIYLPECHRAANLKACRGWDPVECAGLCNDRGLAVTVGDRQREAA